MNIVVIRDVFLRVIQSCIENITLPTGENLVPAFRFSLCISGVSLVCHLFDLPITFVDWRGALIATALLLIPAILERKGVNEISRLYRAAKTRAADLAKRAAGPGPRAENGGAAHAGAAVPKKKRGASGSRAKVRRHSDGNKSGRRK